MYSLCTGSVNQLARAFKYTWPLAGQVWPCLLVLRCPGSLHICAVCAYTLKTGATRKTNTATFQALAAEHVNMDLGGSRKLRNSLHLFQDQVP